MGVYGFPRAMRDVLGVPGGHGVCLGDLRGSKGESMESQRVKGGPWGSGGLSGPRGQGRRLVAPLAIRQCLMGPLMNCKAEQVIKEVKVHAKGSKRVKEGAQRALGGQGGV